MTTKLRHLDSESGSPPTGQVCPFVCYVYVDTSVLNKTSLRAKIYKYKIVAGARAQW